MLYIGLDVHKQVCYGTVMNEKGKVTKQARFTNDLEVLEAFMESLDEALVLFRRRSPGRGKRGVKARGLTCEQKVFNRRLSEERVVVKHTISKLKKFYIMAHKFRNRLKNYDAMTDIVCGLVNFRITGTIFI